MSTPLHIPLASAYLCQDCHCVGNCSRRCPACASEVLMGLAGILNREVAEETPSFSYITAVEPQKEKEEQCADRNLS